MDARQTLSRDLFDLSLRLLPDIRKQVMPGDSFNPRVEQLLRGSVDKLAIQCTESRTVPYRLVRSAVEKLKRAGHINRFADLRRVFTTFSSNLNLIHVLASAPEHEPELQTPLHELLAPNSHDMEVLSVKALMGRVSLSDAFYQHPESQGTWLTHARQARRILASPDDFLSPEVKQQLQLSFRNDFQTYVANSPATKKLRGWMTLHGLNASQWLSSDFHSSFSAKPSEQRELDVEAEHLLHQRFYEMFFKLHHTHAVDNSKLRRMFFRAVGQYDASKSDLPSDFIVKANEWFRTHDSISPNDAHFLLPRKAMDDVLLYMTREMRRYIERSEEHSYVSDKFKDFHDQVVALQRTVAGYDHAISLTTGRNVELAPSRTAQYEIHASDKDPIHFYTGGNDSGVCDSTAGPQRATLKDSAINPSMQFHEIFRVDPQGRRTRIGQIRIYMGEVRKPNRRWAPAMLVNSIDLEAEERDNLLLYRRAVDHVKHFAQRVGVDNVFLGRHGDQHLMVFEKSGNFPDLKEAEHTTRLTHFFTPNSGVLPFSDFFRGFTNRGSDYKDQSGLANLYHVAMPTARIRRKR